MNKKQAEGLWNELREAFVNAEAKLKEIIQDDAWTPLGYQAGPRGFVQAYNERLAGVRLATDVAKAHVVYAMFDAGWNDEEVAEATSALGIGVGTGQVIKREWEDGTPADQVQVRRHFRSTPGEPKCFSVELTPEEFQLFRETADRLSLNANHEAAKAVRAHFRKLGQRKR